MNSRLPALSNTERNSVTASLVAGVRLDGRALLENREVAINFGKDFGCCTVSLGDTRVLAQATSEVVEPRPSRPAAGKITTAVHVNCMAGPEYEMGRTTDVQDELQMLLENNIRESRCLDLEALCIMAEESVWQLRVDVTVLNNNGNLPDACNLAAVTALKHFHRPDVSVEEDGRVTIHSFSERSPIPTFLKKIPVCLSYAFAELEDRLLIIADPSHQEERVVKGRLIVGLNPHGEITSMNFPGPIELDRRDIKFCIQNAFARARFVAELVEKAVEEDLEKRKQQTHPTGFSTVRFLNSAAMAKQRFTTRVGLDQSLSCNLRRMRDQVDEFQSQPIPEVKTEQESSSSSEDSSSDEFSDDDRPL